MSIKRLMFRYAVAPIILGISGLVTNVSATLSMKCDSINLPFNSEGISDVNMRIDSIN